MENKKLSFEEQFKKNNSEYNRQLREHCIDNLENLLNLGLESQSGDMALEVCRVFLGKYTYGKTDLKEDYIYYGSHCERRNKNLLKEISFNLGKPKITLCDSNRMYVALRMISKNLEKYLEGNYDLSPEEKYTPRTNCNRPTDKLSTCEEF